MSSISFDRCSGVFSPAQVNCPIGYRGSIYTYSRGLVRRGALPAQVLDQNISRDDPDHRNNDEDLRFMQALQYPIPLLPENITQRNENCRPAKRSRVCEQREIRKIQFRCAGDIAGEMTDSWYEVTD